MAFQLVDHDSGEQVEDLDLTEMTANNQFTVLLIKCHACDITLKAVFEASCRLSFLGVPDIYGSFAGDVEFESQLREHGAEDLVVVRGVRVEGLLVFKYLYDT